MYVYIKKNWSNDGRYNHKNIKKELLVKYIENQLFPKFRDSIGKIDGGIRYDLFFRAPSDNSEQILKELQKYATEPLCIVSKIKFTGCTERKDIKDMTRFMQTHSNVEEKTEKFSFKVHHYVYYDEWTYSIVTERMKKRIERECLDLPKIFESQRKSLQKKKDSFLRSIEDELREIDFAENSIKIVMKNINNEFSDR